MSCEHWINYIKNARKSSFRFEKIRRVYYKFNDDAEMMEEYNLETSILMRRAWKKKQNCFDLQTELDDFNVSMFNWDVELGDIGQPSHDSHFFVRETQITVIVLNIIEYFNDDNLVNSNSPY